MTSWDAQGMAFFMMLGLDMIRNYLCEVKIRYGLINKYLRKDKINKMFFDNYNSLANEMFFIIILKK
jgi:hypothetical protein